MSGSDLAHCWYSAKQMEYYSKCKLDSMTSKRRRMIKPFTYVDADGKQYVVSHTSDTKEHSAKWDDMKYLGKLALVSYPVWSSC